MLQERSECEIRAIQDFREEMLITLLKLYNYYLSKNFIISIYIHVLILFLYGNNYY